MKLTVISVGRPGRKAIPLVRDYEERAGRYWRLDFIEIAASNAPRAADAMADEGERMLDRVPDRHALWALSRKGTGITSHGLASYLESMSVQSAPGIVFAIGGAFGLSEQVLGRADRRLSLSPMTFPHDLARILLLEQIYRAGTIRRNEPYHKGS